MVQRAFSKDCVPKPFGDDIKKGFIEEIALNWLATGSVSLEAAASCRGLSV